MNSDDIIRLARAASIICFAAAAEREKVAAWMVAHLYATGHGDTTEDILRELEWQIAERERKACADIAASYASCEGIAQKIEQDIRARGEL